MKSNKKILCAAALVAAICASIALPACSRKTPAEYGESNITGEVTETEEQTVPEEQVASEEPERPEEEQGEPVTVVQPQPKVERVRYVKPTADGVNIRAGAGSSYKSLGAAEKNTLYILSGEENGWYKTVYKDNVAYISANYCTVVQMDKSATAAIESVIAEGCRYLGVKYVYGATRYHDGSGKKLSGFTSSAFDCSSLMQYIFKMGAGVNLQVNTRTQIYQGTTVSKGGIKRGDLLFFTNASRKNNTGIERVGHVALYLGDNYILHTASDYAKIEQISNTRWSYYIQAQRIL